MQAVTFLNVGFSHHCSSKADAPLFCELISEVLIVVEVLVQHWRGLHEDDFACGHPGE